MVTNWIPLTPTFCPGFASNSQGAPHGQLSDAAPLFSVSLATGEHIAQHLKFWLVSDFLVFTSIHSTAVQLTFVLFLLGFGAPLIEHFGATQFDLIQT